MPTKLFVGSLRSDVTYKQLYGFLTQFGEISKLNLIHDKQDREKCRGFGFVTFFSKHSVDMVLSEPLNFQGRQLIIRKQLTGDELQNFQQGLKNRRLFVANLNPGTNDKDFHSYFSQFGELESAFIVKDFKTQKSLSYGYIIFKNLSEMHKTLNYKGHLLQGRELVLEKFLGKQGKRRNNESDRNMIQGRYSSQSSWNHDNSSQHSSNRSNNSKQGKRKGGERRYDQKHSKHNKSQRGGSKGGYRGRKFSLNINSFQGSDSFSHQSNHHDSGQMNFENPRFENTHINMSPFESNYQRYNFNQFENQNNNQGGRDHNKTKFLKKFNSETYNAQQLDEMGITLNQGQVLNDKPYGPFNSKFFSQNSLAEPQNQQFLPPGFQRGNNPHINFPLTPEMNNFRKLPHQYKLSVELTSQEVSSQELSSVQKFKQRRGLKRKASAYSPSSGDKNLLFSPFTKSRGFQSIKSTSGESWGQPSIHVESPHPDPQNNNQGAQIKHSFQSLSTQITASPASQQWQRRLTKYTSGADHPVINIKYLPADSILEETEKYPNKNSKSGNSKNESPESQNQLEESYSVTDSKELIIEENSVLSSIKKESFKEWIDKTPKNSPGFSQKSTIPEMLKKSKILEIRHNDGAIRFNRTSNRGSNKHPTMFTMMNIN